MLKPRTFYLSISVFLPLLVYILTSPHKPVAFGDSDELTTSGYLFGFPHPPGYPLLNILIYVFTHLPLQVPIAFKANFASIVPASLALGIFFLLCLQCIELLFNKRDPKIPEKWTHVLSLAFTLFFAFTPLFWTYAIVAEVFALEAFFSLLILYVSLQLYKSWNNKLWYALSLLIGLSLAHQQKSLLIIIPSLFLLTRLFKKQRIQLFKGLFIMCVTPILLYAFLLFFANQNAPQSWQITKSTGGILHYILRNDYKTPFEKNAYITDVISLDNIHAFTHYLSTVVFQLSIPVTLISVLGLILLLQNRQNTVSKYLISLFFLAALFVGFYLTLTTDQSMPAYQALITAITERMYMFGLSMWILLVVIAIYAIIHKYALSVKYSYILLIIPFLQCILHASNHTLSKYSGIHDYGVQILQTLPQNSVLACFSDISCFSIINIQAIEHVRPDVAVIPMTPQLQSYAMQNFPELFQLNYSQNPQRISSIMSWALHLHKRVFVSELPPDYIEFMGLDGKSFFLTPHDLIFEITSLPQTGQMDTRYQISDWQKQTSQPFVKAFNAILLEQFAKNGTLYARLNEKKSAQEYYVKALHIDPQNKTVTQLLQSLSSYGGAPEFMMQDKPIQSQDILRKEIECEGDTVCLTRLYQLGSYNEPLNAAIRQKLIELYTKLGMTLAVSDEQENINRLVEKGLIN